MLQVIDLIAAHGGDVMKFAGTRMPAPPFWACIACPNGKSLLTQRDMLLSMFMRILIRQATP
jgi:hypothetical protein